MKTNILLGLLAGFFLRCSWELFWINQLPAASFFTCVAGLCVFFIFERRRPVASNRPRTVWETTSAAEKQIVRWTVVLAGLLLAGLSFITYYL